MRILSAFAETRRELQGDAMKKNKFNISGYVEQLACSIKGAVPYYSNGPDKLSGEKTIKNQFPQKPGVYIILRKCQFVEDNYRYKGLSTKSPVVLYVGKTTSRRSIAKRLGDHFGNAKPNFQGSQFVRFLMQVVQDEDAVIRILYSPKTLIACVPIDESDEVIDAVEKLAMQVIEPRFNIKDR